jgi:hydroxymethylbilane synthase
MSLIFATRPSKLARWQTTHIIASLEKICPNLECQEQVITTKGDRILDRPLPEIGGKGLFTQELEAALLSGKVHAAVHSLKDLPVEDPPGLVIAAIPRRGEVRDVLISAQGYHLETLPKNARVGTSSLRRGAQLLALRPDLKVEPLRGNVDTRLRKALNGEYDAIILAGAGLVRLGLQEHITQWLELDIMLPAPGQGALAVQSRAADEGTLQYLGALEDAPTRLAVTAERAFLTGLGGGCSLPVGAYAHLQEETIIMRGIAASADGKHAVHVHGQDGDPQALGQKLAQQALAQGAASFLEME